MKVSRVDAIEIDIIYIYGRCMRLSLLLSFTVFGQLELNDLIFRTQREI